MLVIDVRRYSLLQDRLFVNYIFFGVNLRSGKALTINWFRKALSEERSDIEKTSFHAVSRHEQGLS